MEHLVNWKSLIGDGEKHYSSHDDIVWLTISRRGGEVVKIGCFEKGTWAYASGYKIHGVVIAWAEITKPKPFNP
jgi:hypothetical protein